MVNSKRAPSKKTALSIIVRRNVTSSKQQGVVLIVALVFLVALTGVAAALMQNTTSDMKMTGASNEKVVALQAAVSAVDEVIDNQVNISATNMFAQGLEKISLYTSAELLPASTKTKATASTNVINNPTFEAHHCPRSRVSHSLGTIDCNFFQLKVERKYGRSDTSTVTIDTNIAQQILGSNN